MRRFPELLDELIGAPSRVEVKVIPPLVGPLVGFSEKNHQHSGLSARQGLEGRLDLMRGCLKRLINQARSEPDGRGPIAGAWVELPPNGEKGPGKGRDS